MVKILIWKKLKIMKSTKLKLPAIIILFITSYIPLFILLIISQLKQNKKYLNYSEDGFYCFFKMFGLSIFLTIVIFIGFYSLKQLLENFKSNINNGDLVKIVEVENKNSESIAYISTYIVPFVFQDTNEFLDLVSIFLILILIFFIYVKSDMIVVNPILNIRYSIYQIEYQKNNIQKKGILISQIEEINKNQEIKINQISKDIYYGH
jgi:hypothetical protein